MTDGIKILGTIDIIAGLLLLLIHFDIGNFKLPLILTVYFGIKLWMFHKDLHSYIDGFTALYSWIIFMGFASLFDYVLVIYLVQKGLASYL